MTFEDLAELPRSEKITLVTIDSTKQAKIFNLYSGNVYSRVTDYFVISVRDDQTELTQAANVASVTSGKFFYDITAKTLYVHVSGGVDPVERDLYITYRHFFSNAPLILPYDLNTGEEIEWLPFIESIGSIGQQLDDENTGIVLESSSNIKLINTHGFFDEIFDQLIWENKEVHFYSWISGSHISEAREIFDGVVETKDFSFDSVTFNVKDFVFRLRDFVNLELFSSSDGTLSPSLLGTPKRRIYGQVKQVKLAGIDNVLDGFNLTGTGTVLITTSTLTGIGTQFLKELSVGDEISFIVNNEVVKFGIEQVVSDTEAVLNSESEVNIIKQSITNAPSVNYRYLNRRWHIAGHKLREPTTTIASIIAPNRYQLSSTQDLFAGDRVLINGDNVVIRRISGNEMVLNNAISPLPIVSDVVKKIPIQNVFFGDKELIYLRDWDYTNSTEAYIDIEETAEFNITQQRGLGVSLTFTATSRSLTTSATVDFRSILKPRDWIRKSSLVSGENDWYEIIDVKEQEIIIREPFTGTTATTTALIKQVNYIGDDALITANCLGMEANGSWIKTPSDTVRHLVLNDAGFASVNEASFTQANADCDYIVSMIIPESLESEAPSIRDVITKINESVFGSLYGNNSLSISYSILNSTKPESDVALRDDDIISFSCETSTDIRNKIKVHYRPFIDYFTGESTFEVINYNSGFVDKNIGINATLEKTLYLYEDDKAEIIAQRLALFNSMGNTRLTIKGKMNLFLKSVNDKIFVRFDRLYKRFGGGDRLKIGIVTGVKKSQTEAEITVSDLSNLFNRVPSIAPDTTSDYSLSRDTDRVRWGFIVDNNSLTPDIASESDLGNNIIG